MANPKKPPAKKKNKPVTKPVPKARQRRTTSIATKLSNFFSPISNLLGTNPLNSYATTPLIEKSKASTRNRAKGFRSTNLGMRYMKEYDTTLKKKDDRKVMDYLPDLFGLKKKRLFKDKKP